MKRAWLLCSFMLALLAGCGEVEHCQDGDERGCVNAAPRVDGSCLFDLVPYNLADVGPLCIEPGAANDPCKACVAGAMCVPAVGGCVAFCELPAVLPGSGSSPEVIFCEAVEDGTPGAAQPAFDEVCRRRCRLECQRIEQLCGARCEEGRCERPEVQTECERDCPQSTASGGRDLACITRSCEDQRLSRCDANLACPNGAKVDCTQVTCTNDCAHADDGHCDDGDIFASERSDCRWGSDCADCGVRRGAPSRGYLGDVCRYHGNCQGGTQAPSTATAWCVESATLPGVARCMADCSRGQACADGFACYEVTIDSDGLADGERAPIADGRYTSQACLPLMCI